MNPNLTAAAILIGTWAVAVTVLAFLPDIKTRLHRKPVAPVIELFPISNVVPLKRRAE